MVRTVFSHKDAARVSHEFCSVVGHGGTNHPNADFMVGGQKTHLCGIYDLPDCKSHEEMSGTLSQRGLLKDVRGTPTHILYNPHDLTEISRAHGMTLGNIEEAVAAAQKVLGKPVPWKEYQKILKPLEDAKTAFAAGDARKALKALGDFDPKGVEALKTQADALRAEIFAAGEKRLEEAKGLIEQGEKAKALKILRDVAADYAGTDVADKAKELIPQAKTE